MWLAWANDGACHGGSLSLSHLAARRHRVQSKYICVCMCMDRTVLQLYCTVLYVRDGKGKGPGQWARTDGLGWAPHSLGLHCLGLHVRPHAGKRGAPPLQRTPGQPPHSSHRVAERAAAAAAALSTSLAAMDGGGKKEAGQAAPVEVRAARVPHPTPTSLLTTKQPQARAPRRALYFAPFELEQACGQDRRRASPSKKGEHHATPRPAVAVQ